MLFNGENNSGVMDAQEEGSEEGGGGSVYHLTP